MTGEDAVLRVGGQEYMLPVIVGTEGEIAVDINQLRTTSGIVTFDRGFANTAETESAITFLDGEQGILRYRGYPIEQIAEQASFLEVAYLLSKGELPTRPQLDDYVDEITHHTMLREDMKYLFEAFPKEAHPMQILASAISALATYYPDAVDPGDTWAADISMKRLLAKVPTMVAWSFKYSRNQPYVYPRNDLDYVANFLNMIFSFPTEEYEVDPAIAKALNVLLILHADHEQNCSSTTVRVVGSGHANLFSSVAAGVHALSGPLHGGANQRVVEMLEEIVAAGGDIAPFVARAKDREDPFRLMGFGHRVYRNYDPRAQILKRYAQQVVKTLSKNDPLLDAALQLEQVTLEDDYFIEKKLYPNVDFYSGIIYRTMGFPTNLFTVLFAIGRLPGWIAQWWEMKQDATTKIGRPRQIYVGETKRDWKAITERP
ncbi:MAG TPA: citrate synthase [Acidimicrobiia bacterium]|nr:citrate synthase [Acidimicrobiia bacterium]